MLWKKFRDYNLFFTCHYYLFSTPSTISNPFFPAIPLFLHTTSLTPPFIQKKVGLTWMLREHDISSFKHSHCINAGKDNTEWEVKAKSQQKSQKQPVLIVLGAPQVDLATQLPHYTKWLDQFHIGSLVLGSVSVRSYEHLLMYFVGICDIWLL